jgi:hypothetical protein
MSVEQLSAPEIVSAGYREASQNVNPSGPSSHFRAGDLVAVRAPHAILKTLDANGTLDNLPFMPEMLEFCGRRFRVLNRVVQSTIDGAFLGHHAESFVREFKNNDVVILQGVRCSGAGHDGCQRGCAIFWKDSWLEKVDNSDHDCAPQKDSLNVEPDELCILKTKTASGKYFCQSSEFLKATLNLSSGQRIRKCFSAVAAGNISVWGMLKRILEWMWWRAYTRVIGQHVRGTVEKTPTESLGLKSGDLVEIKSLPEIVATLNKDGRNRGLHFSADQRPFCGGQFRVRSRADNFIAEGTGEMKHFRNTVMLEDVLCDSACFAFGGCYRADLLYWREIWLRRVEAQPNLADSEADNVSDSAC